MLKKLFALLLLPIGLLAQPTEKLVKVIVAPDHIDWTYKPGEPVRFTIRVLQHGNPVAGSSLSYKIGPEMLPATKEGTLPLDTTAVQSLPVAP